MRAGEDADQGRIGCIHQDSCFPLQNPGLNISAQMPGHGGVMLMSTEDLDHQGSSSGTGPMGPTAVTSWAKAGVELVGVGVGAAGWGFLVIARQNHQGTERTGVFLLRQ